jgi:hypothetical protein
MKLTGWDILYLTEQDQYVGSAVAWGTLGEWNLPTDDETPYSDMWDMGTMHDADYCDMMDYIRDGKWT